MRLQRLLVQRFHGAIDRAEATQLSVGKWINRRVPEGKCYNILLPWLTKFKVNTSQGKQEKWWKVIPERQNREFENFLEKHRERASQNQEDKSEEKWAPWHRWFYVWSYQWFEFITIIHKENWNYTGNFTFQEKWESWFSMAWVCLWCINCTEPAGQSYNRLLMGESKWHHVWVCDGWF